MVINSDVFWTVVKHKISGKMDRRYIECHIETWQAHIEKWLGLAKWKISNLVRSLSDSFLLTCPITYHVSMKRLRIILSKVKIKSFRREKNMSSFKCAFFDIYKIYNKLEPVLLARLWKKMGLENYLDPICVESRFKKRSVGIRNKRAQILYWKLMIEHTNKMLKQIDTKDKRFTVVMILDKFDIKYLERFVYLQKEISDLFKHE